MEKEIIYGQIIAKANHYMAVPGNGGLRRIIKDDKIRKYEQSFREQCTLYKDKHISDHFILHAIVWQSSLRFDLDNSIKTLLDCLQYVNAISDDNLCFKIDAEKRVNGSRPRIEFWLEPINEQAKLF
jgi:Holliday junction resolvase RusA-like endonuclease